MVASLMNSDYNEVKDKVYTRDLFNGDQPNQEINKALECNKQIGINKKK